MAAKLGSAETDSLAVKVSGTVLRSKTPMTVSAAAGYRPREHGDHELKVGDRVTVVVQARVTETGLKAVKDSDAEAPFAKAKGFKVEITAVTPKPKKKDTK